MKKYLFLLGLLMSTLSLFAQEASVGKSLFSVHAGPSWYLGKMIGITNNSDAYRSDLRNGVSWGVNYYYLGDKYIFDSFKLSPGLIYQGGQYKNSHDEGSDKILMNYIAPQIALFYVKQKFNLSLSTGLGYQLYKDKSFVYDKPRNWIVTSSDSYSVKYHGQKWQVESPELNGGGGCFSQLSLLFGMNFHF